MEELKVERTGREYGMSSCEFLITFPDGTQTATWSPPWHDMTPEEEEDTAKLEALRLWEERKKERGL